MAEQLMEEAQLARRRADYEALSDDEVETDLVNPFATSTPHVSFSSINTPPPARQEPRSYLSAGSARQSLLDGSSFELGPVPTASALTGRSQLQPGLARFLEMEEEPIRVDTESKRGRQDFLGDEPIKTSSGLLLTHRRTPTSSTPRVSQSMRNYETDDKKYTSQSHFFSFPSAFRPVAKPRDFFEMDNYGLPPRGYSNGGQSPAMRQAKRLMSYVRFWVFVSFLVLLAATGVLLHSFRHVEANLDELKADTHTSNNQLLSATNFDVVPEQVILVPMENISELALKQPIHLEQQPHYQLAANFHTHTDQTHTDNRHSHSSNHHSHTDNRHPTRRMLLELRQEFEDWILHHGKKYHSADEKEHRFRIWTDNHQRTIEKNRRHGPCKMSKKHVFGSNHFKDLSPEEFKAKYLTGYKGPRGDVVDELSPTTRKLTKGSGQVMGPHVHKMKMHPTVMERKLQLQEPTKTLSSRNCAWYDISCWLRFICHELGITFGSNIMEPDYDSNSYPKSVDWRTLGAVTEVRTQGDCGACWAITAVETVESAHFIATGTLYDLSEAEIITCDDTCEMCNGGWPQNAYEWVMDHGGLPKSSSFAYDGSTLMALTEADEGTSNKYTEDDLQTYRSQVCPANDNSGSNSGSGDYYDDGKENQNYGDYSDSGRYGNIKGYGYATDRCVCYSDGSGCECDGQDESLAVRNLATYGPAVVCLEASLWQDYTGGIITSDLGCTSAFLDMNHCVQAVGYAFSDGSNYDDGDEDDENEDSKSNSGSGSQDSSQREGYWIIRNQWGYNWGMSGYAYVAMGENTCGVLNDMTQAYL